MVRKIEISGLYSFGGSVQTIDFTAKPKSRIKNTKYEDNFNLFQDGKPMKSALFFGCNATGKTNFFMGVKILLDIINYGLRQTQNKCITNSVINNKSDDIKLGIELSNNNGDIYYYSIVFNLECVIKERLLKNEKIIFDYKDKVASFSIYKDKESNQELGKIFSSIVLTDNIISYLKDFNNPEVNEIIKLSKDIEVYMTSNYSKAFVVDFEKSKKDYFVSNKEKILEIFQNIDSSIDDFDFDEFERDDKTTYTIYFKRNEEKFSYQIESEGLKKIVNLADKLYDVVKNNKVLFIDELDSSISTMALISIFNDMINIEENKSGQLIVSSHNLLLFDVSFLNSQQIFLVQKNSKLETIVKTYYEYDIRSEKKRAYIDYLKGYYNE